jgi:hypothetical protein
MRKIRLNTIVLVLALFAFVGCKEDEILEKKNFFFEASEYISPSVKFEIEQAKKVLNEKQMTELASLVAYDFKVYKLKYKTFFEGDTITVSGVVAIPLALKASVSFPILSYQHPLLVQKSEAPSENIEDQTILYLASTGMVVMMPDYIGFGASKEHFHPYLNKKYSSTTVIDFIRATKEFIATEKPCKTDDYLFLMGYGQGAGASLASLSAIENNTIYNDLKITATSCSNGFYDLIDFRKWLVKQPRFEEPYLIVNLLESFTMYSGLKVDYSLVFSSEIGPSVSGIIDGKKSVDEINKIIGTTHVGEMLNDDFEKDSIFNNSAVYKTMREAFTENSISAWKINSSLALYYGTNNKMIPSDQSIIVYQGFQKQGVGANVKPKPLNGMDHVSAFVPSVVESVKWFKSLSTK